MFATPFSVDVDDVPPSLQMELIELQSSDALHTKFGELGFKEFYRHIKDDCSNIKMYSAKRWLSSDQRIFANTTFQK